MKLISIHPVPPDKYFDQNNVGSRRFLLQFIVMWSQPAYTKKPEKSTNTEAEIALRGHSLDPEVDLLPVKGFGLTSTLMPSMDGTLSEEFPAGVSKFALRVVSLTC